jgi:hypothetical protein
MINLKDRGINNPQSFSPFSEEQQFNEVCILLQQNIVAALKLANSNLKDKKYFQNLLEKGLESANASEIEIWLKYLIPRLGFRYVVNVLEKKVELQSEQVQIALYWLPKFLKKDSLKELQLLKNLEKRMIPPEMQGKEYKANLLSGKTYKLILKIKNTNEYAIFGGYQLGSNGSGVIVEILDSNFYQTGGVKVVAPKDLEILDPQPYK